MTLSLARVLGPEMRINTVCPGFVQVRWQQQWLGDGYEACIKQEEATNPLGCAGRAEDMAEVAIAFLTGRHHITGEVILSDSGGHLGSLQPRHADPFDRASTRPRLDWPLHWERLWHV